VQQRKRRHDSNFGNTVRVSADCSCVAPLGRMMVMPAMAVVMSVVVASVMTDLTRMALGVDMHVMQPGRVAVRAMVVVRLMEPWGPLALLKLGM